MKISFLALLTVGYCKGRPFLIKKPANQVANVGDTVELRCIVGGQRMVEYVNKAVQWVDQTKGQTINTFAGGRNINQKVKKTGRNLNFGHVPVISVFKKSLPRLIFQSPCEFCARMKLLRSN